MVKIQKIIAQSPLRTVQVIRDEGQTTLQVCTLMAQEVGGKYANSYAIQLFGDMATQVFNPGELVLAALRFKARQNGESIFQDVVADEILRLTTPNAQVKPLKNLENGVPF